MSFTLDAGRFTAKSPRRNVFVFVETGSTTQKYGRMTPEAEALDERLNGAISYSLRGSRFSGAMGEMHKVTFPDARGLSAISQVVLVGVGKLSSLERRDFWHLGMRLAKQADALGLKDASICLGAPEVKPGLTEAALALVEGMHMALYRFETFKSEMKPHQLARFEELTVLTNDRTARELLAGWPGTLALLEATDSARNAANLPPNTANPQFMAAEAEKLSKHGIKVTVLDEKQLTKLGMNLMMAVGGNAAEADQPRLVIMEYNGAGKDAPKTAIVGKGIMFDTGGYNIKIQGSMAGMKFDMCGAAAVLGTMQALAARKPRVNVVGVMACAMNMIGSVPFLPDSVYKSYKGLFVEIGNTDAEGRLVLADAMAYTIEKYAPAQLVDLATLTGACMAALGGSYAGLFTNTQALGNALRKAGDDMGERLWPLPVDDVYAAKPKVADVNNDGAPYGGASTGAVFLKKFAGTTPWAHLDIAGVGNKDKTPGTPEHLPSGATGFGVRLLTRWLETQQEEVADASAKASKKRGRGRPRKAA